MVGSHVACLSLQVGAEEDGLVAGRLRGSRCGGEGIGRPGDDGKAAPGEGRIAGLGRIGDTIGQKGPRRGWQVEPIPGDHCLGLRERRRVGDGRAGGNDRRVVMRDVRDGERHLCGRGSLLGEPAALDPGQALAQRVDLADGGARAQQAAGDVLLLLQGEVSGRRDPVGGAAARQQDEDEVVRAGRRRQVEHVARRGNTGGVRHRVPRLDQPHRAGRFAIADAGDGDAAETAGRSRQQRCVVVHRDRGHARRGLAGGQHDDPAGRGGRRRQCCRQAGPRMRRRDSRVVEAAQQVTTRILGAHGQILAEAPRNLLSVCRLPSYSMESRPSTGRHAQRDHDQRAS